MLRSVRRIALVSPRPSEYSSWARGSAVCFPSSSSIVSFHIDAYSEPYPRAAPLLYRGCLEEGNKTPETHPLPPIFGEIMGPGPYHPLPMPGTLRPGQLSSAQL